MQHRDFFAPLRKPKGVFIFSLLQGNGFAFSYPIGVVLAPIMPIGDGRNTTRPC
jgi:hypothetical protein